MPLIAARVGYGPYIWRMKTLLLVSRAPPRATPRHHKKTSFDSILGDAADSPTRAMWPCPHHRREKNSLRHLDLAVATRAGATRAGDQRPAHSTRMVLDGRRSPFSQRREGLQPAPAQTPPPPRRGDRGTLVPGGGVDRLVSVSTPSPSPRAKPDDLEEKKKKDDDASPMCGSSPCRLPLTAPPTAMLARPRHLDLRQRRRTKPNH